MQIDLDVSMAPNNDQYRTKAHICNMDLLKLELMQMQVYNYIFCVPIG